MLSPSLEDYLETVYLLGRDGSSVRPKEIITRLGVTGPSVTEALHALTGKNLINYTPYGTITLTHHGERVAREIYHRHATLKRFFVEVLGIDEQLAEEGACKMEHSATADLIRRLVIYTRFTKTAPDDHQQNVAESFKQYLQQCGYQDSVENTRDE